MYHFILNPASRSGLSEKIWFQTIEPYLNLHHIDYLVHFSQEKGHITTIVKEIQETDSEISRIVVLGGDGTINEAIQGITDFSRVYLGLIPIGSSNDLTRDMDFPRDPIQAIEKIVSIVTPTPTDYGTVTYEDGHSENFLVSCGIGFDAAVCEESNRSEIKGFLNKLGIGKLIYLNIALKQLFSAASVSATITVKDGETRTINKLLFLAFMNHKHEGGGFMFAPDASYTDGLLSMCEVGDVSKFKILTALPTAYKGKHYKYKGISGYTASDLTIQTSEPLWVHVDGEVSHKSSQIRVQCHKNKLLFLC